MVEPRDEAWSFIHKLFAPEVPEIASGVVEIRAVARIPGVRTKVAVHSLDPRVDGVGACIGEHHRAIDAIGARLGKERLDLIPWSDSPERLVSLALAPARVERVSARSRAAQGVRNGRAGSSRARCGPRRSER